jgi:outer membrane receptor protein involved in Fe transport
MMTLGLLVLCAAPAAASGFVEGLIKDSGGAPIAAAHVVLIAPAHRYESVSAGDGAFTIPNVQAGAYGLQVRAPGFAPIANRQIAVSDDTPTHLEIVLQRAAAGGVATLGSVIVNGSAALSRASAPTTDINPQTLAARGVVQLSDVLAQQISVTMVRQGGGAPGLPQSAALRGPDPSETIVDVDGHQVNNNNTGDVALELLDPAEFAGVQVVYGIAPSSLVGANSEGGAINFRTIEPTAKTQGLLRASYGSFDTFGETIEATGTDERIGYAALYRRFTTQGQVFDYPITIATPGPGMPAQTAIVGSSIDGTITLAKLRYSIPGSEGFLEVGFRDAAAIRDLSAPLSAPDDPADAAPNAPFTAVNAPGASVSSSAPSYSADLQLPLGAKDANGIVPATLTLRHLTQFYDQSTENISPTLNPYLINEADRIDDDIVSYERASSAASNGTLALVYDIRRERLTAADAFAPGPPTQYAIERWAVGRYTWSPTARLHYTTALYYSAFSTFGTSLDPRVALVWTPPDSVVRASFGTGFRAPLLSELAFNPAFQPERSVEYELGAEHIFGHSRFATHGVFNAYRTLIDDAGFQTINAAGQLTFLGNIGQSYYQGVELRADQAVTATVALHASYGINSAFPTINPFTLNPAAPDVIPGEQFQGIPLHKAQLLADRQAQPGGVNYSLTGSYESTNNELDRGAYVLLDAAVGMTFGHTDVSVAGSNLTDQFDQKFTLIGAGVPYPVPGGTMPTDAYSLQGRAVRLTVTQRF